MNIAEAERRTGLSRANIRFYEKEGLLTPTRGANGYRDYTEDDVQTLRKIVLLRRLRLSVPEIRAIESGEAALSAAAEQQLAVLQGDIREGEQAYAMCRAICDDKAEWNGLDVDRYQAIREAADDPREQDRVLPVGCPWRRAWARGLDTTLYGLLFSLFAQWGLRLNPDNFPSLLWTIASGYAGWLLTFAFEPLLLHLWGTTFGKWIFGFSVRDEDGNKLSIRTAYTRLWGVFSYGSGYGIPIYDLYRYYQCYKACTKEELPWDLENGCAIVVHDREVRWYRIAAYLVMQALCAAAGVGIDWQANMPPHQGEMTLEEFVENCNDYLKYHGDYAPYVMPDGSWNEDVPQEGRTFGLTNLADVSVETDENGYVQSVTVTADSQDGPNGEMQRETVYYAFAASRMKLSYFGATYYNSEAHDTAYCNWNDNVEALKETLDSYYNGTNMNIQYAEPEDTHEVNEARLCSIYLRNEYEYRYRTDEITGEKVFASFHSVYTLAKEEV